MKVNGDDVFVGIYRGDAFYYLAEYSEAIANYNRAVEINSSDAFSKQKQYTQALSYARALEIDSKNAFAWFNYADLNLLLHPNC